MYVDLPIVLAAQGYEIPLVTSANGTADSDPLGPPVVCSIGFALREGRVVQHLDEHDLVVHDVEDQHAVLGI
jgi:hypothetical protein